MLRFGCTLYIACESIPSGLDLLHELTSARNYKLRIDLADFNGNHRYAEYSSFKVGSSATNYVLTVGTYSGNASVLYIHLKYLFYKNCISVCEFSRFHTSIYSSKCCVMLIVNCYLEFISVDTDMNAVVDSPFERGFHRERCGWCSLHLSCLSTRFSINRIYNFF